MSSVTLLATHSEQRSKSFPWPCELLIQIGTCHGHLPSASTRIKSCAAAASNFQHSLKRVQGGEQKWGILCSGKNWQNRSSDRYFQEPILGTQFFYLLIPRKALKSFMVMSAPCDQQKPSEKNTCLIARTPPLPKSHIYWPSPLPLWSSFSKLPGVLSLGLWSSFIGKDSDAGKDWKQEEKEMTEDEMVGWHHRLNGLEFEQAQGVGDGQGSLACWSPRGCKESDMTEQLNWLTASNKILNSHVMHFFWQPSPAFGGTAKVYIALCHLPNSSPITLPHLPSPKLPWPPCGSLMMPRRLLPQGLCDCCVLQLKSPVPRCLHGFLPGYFEIFAQMSL